jgi:hypothetical protein
MADLMTLLLKRSTEISNAAAHPFLTPHWVAGDLIGEHSFKGGQDFRMLRLDQRPAYATTFFTAYKTACWGAVGRP